MAQPKTAAEWIFALDLKPHPEGGFYRESWRANGCIRQDSLPEGVEGERPYATAIYFLLSAGQISHWHRIRSDELWFHHAGCPLEIIMLLPEGREVKVALGLDLAAGQEPQLVVPADSWFGSRLLAGTADYALVSCTVAPGFDFRDFRLASAVDMERSPALWRYPQLVPLSATNR